MQSFQNKIHYQNFTWIDINQPTKEALDKISEEYQLDKFQIIDSFEHGHLPKFEKLPHYNFLILRAFTSKIDECATTIADLSNKIAFFYNSNLLITIHRKNFTFLESTKINYSNCDELILYFVKKMVETYQQPLDQLDDNITDVEQMIFIKNYSKINLKDLYFIKSQTRITLKLLHIFQNVINQIKVDDNSQTALQDIKDNLLNLILNYDEVLENANNLLHTYLSVNSMKSNEVMKLLTIFSAFFLPLTFIAGIYGMNFVNMPELEWQEGYFYILVL